MIDGLLAIIVAIVAGKQLIKEIKEDRIRKKTEKKITRRIIESNKELMKEWNMQQEKDEK